MKIEKIFLIICWFALMGQAAKVLAQVVPDIKTPTTYQFIKNGIIPVKLYTGQAKVSIPLFEIKEADLNLSGTINYSSEGFRPNIDDGDIGLNWSLFCGGVITRTIYGIADEQTDGLFQRIKDGLVVNINDIKNGIIDPNYDMPDIFHFSFAGYSGSFFSDYNGDFYIQSDDKFKIEYVHRYSSGIDNVSPSLFIITDENGYKYYFGYEYLNNINDLDNIEIIGNSNLLNTQLPESGRYNSSLYLTKIVSPTQKEIEIKYKRYTKNYLHNIASTSSDRIIIRRYNDYKLIPGSINPSNSEQEEMLSDVSFFSNLVQSGKLKRLRIDEPSYSSWEFSSGVVEQITRKVYIDEISSPMTKIKFYYNQKSRRFYENVNSINITNDPHNWKLDSIIVSSNSYSIKKRKISFEHLYLGGSLFKRFFLSHLNVNGETYNFDYWDVDKIPDPLNGGVDHWGYYNGTSLANVTRTLGFSIDTYGEFTLSDNSRDADTSKCRIGLLKNIQYPTGGFTDFIYEGHDFSQIIKRKRENGFLPSFYQENSISGGARIKKVINRDNLGNRTVKQFFYKKGFLPDKTSDGSSGIICHFPTYFKLKPVINYNSFQVEARNNDLFSYMNLSENYIVYSDVVEFEEGNGYTQYHFINPIENPDILFNSDTKCSASSGFGSAYYYTINNLELLPCSKAFERGKVKKQELKDKNGNIVLSNIFTYNNNPLRYSEGGYFAGNVNVFYYGFSGFYFTDKISKNEEKRSFNGNDVINVTEYEYNTTKLLKKKTIYNDLNQRITENYRYPVDYSNDECISGYNQCVANCRLLNIDKTELMLCINGCTDELGICTSSPEVTTLNKLVALHRLSDIVERYTTKLVNETENLIDSKLTKFYEFSPGIIKPKESYYLNLTNPFPLSSYQVSNIANGTGFVFDSRLMKKDQFLHDENGNVIEFESVDNMKNSFYWGYNNLYLVVKASNVTYAILNAALQTSLPTGFTTLDDLLATISSPTDSRWKLFNQNLRTNVTLIGAMITTYTYNPLEGITSQTDMNGISTFYEYDGNGHLVLVKDDKGNVLKRYEYHYSTQN